MKFLLDTHVFLWWLADSGKLPVAARRAIEAPANEVLVSAVSIWEMRLAASIEEAELCELAVTARHAAQVRRLPPHHRDPFDRLLIAQAQVEDATLVTTEGAMDAYDVSRLGR